MNNVKIAAGINVFNDAKSLRRTLQSCTELFDTIYIIDGRYPDYPTEDNEKYSTDGTLELIQEYNNCRYIKCYAEQSVKRTKYLKECKHDFLLVIDADEYLVTKSWPTFQDQLQRYILNIPARHRFYQYQIDYETEPNKHVPMGRLFYNPNNLIYVNHWTLIADPVIDNKPVISSVMIEGITIRTDDMLRPYTRLQYDIDYQWDLFRKENVITENVYNDTECKQNFANHIIWEVNVWKEHLEGEKKIKYVSRFKKKH